MRFARTSLGLFPVNGLGLIPAWQFSQNPAINLKINPHVQFPPGVYQTTPQPLYPYYQGPEGLGRSKVTLLGLARPWFRRNKKTVAGVGLGLAGLGILGAFLMR